MRIILLLLIVNVAATPALAQTSSARQPATTQPPAATILSRTDGAVFVKTGSADERRARTDDRLFSDDAIRTAKGYAQLLQVAKPNSQYELKPQSRVSLRVLDGAGDFRTRLERGTMIVRESVAGRATPRDCNRGASGMTVEVPDGTATGCGTEWSIQVSEPDPAGRVTVTVAVPDGAVQLSNEIGTVTVRENRVGQMRRGEAPQELRLIQPGDRVQFVEYYQASAASYAAAGVEVGQTADAIDKLAQSISASSSAAEQLALVDLLLAAGDYTGARDRASQGGAQYPANGRFDAMRAQVELLEGGENWYDLGTKYADEATKKSPSIVDGWLVSGQLGYRGGDATKARNGFTEATKVAPKDPRGFLGLSTVATELEDLALARRQLEEAGTLRPNDPEHLAQLGTVEALENRLQSAHKRFDESLATAPTNYLARTGKALVSLKQGKAEAAEELLRTTTLLQPRYARAHQLMAVAHYRQDGFADAALSDLKRASGADEKDPAPYFLKAMIDTDYFRPDAAMAAARTAQINLPFLKSLNQVANNQKGTANLGNAFAFVGLEDWAEHFAQESYLSSWAGSHFFLGDRYPGRFNKNSEYFQGLLSDPTVFGASPRFEALVQKPGTYVTAGTRMEVDNYDPRFLDTIPYLTLNGYNNARIPVAYFVNATTQEGRYLGNTDERLKQTVPYGTGAIGLRPTPKLNVFATVTANQLKGRYVDDDGFFDDTYRDRKADVGLQYRFGPRSTIWARASRSRSTLIGAFDEGVPGGDSDSLRDTVDGEEYQLRQTLSALHHEVSWGLEVGRRPRVQSFVDVVDGEQRSFRDTYTTRSEVAYIADRFAVSKWWLLEALVAVTRWTDADTTPDYKDATDQIDVAPRLGLVGRFGPERLVRLSYQDWVRPASDSALAPVAIAGVPVDDRVVDYLGRLKATRAQVEWAWTAKTFMKAFVAREKVVDRDFVTPANAPKPPQNALRALERIRNKTLTNTATSDLYEGSALYDVTVDRGGLALNQVIGRGIAATARYEFTDSRDNQPEEPHARYTPRHMSVLGATWVSPRRFYVSGQAVHRTARLGPSFDGIDAETLPADWEANVIAYWELPNKRWSLEARATDLLPRGNSPLTFSADLKFRY